MTLSSVSSSKPLSPALSPSNGDEDFEDISVPATELHIIPDEVLSDEAIKKMYQTFTSDLHNFGSHPTVVFEHLLTGLRRAYNGGQKNAWDKVQQLQNEISAKDRELKMKDFELQGKDRLLEAKDREISERLG